MRPISCGGRALLTNAESLTAIRVVFAPVATGDAVFVDVGDRLYLLDCGAGLDYAASIEALGHHHLSGLVLTHAHADHWLALPEVLPLLGPDAWVARPGTVLAPELMRQQGLFEFYRGHVDRQRLMDAWSSLPARALGELPGQPLWDLNAEASGQHVVLAEPDSRRVHRACIVPALRCGPHVGVFGADLDGEEWARLVPELPARVALLQAPNHGGPPGRMARWVLDQHLRPQVVVVTDAQPFADDHLEWYSGEGREVYSLQERQTIVVLLAEGGVEVGVGGLELPRAVA
jgi:hypothetical protein